MKNTRSFYVKLHGTTNVAKQPKDGTLLKQVEDFADVDNPGL